MCQLLEIHQIRKQSAENQRQLKPPRQSLALFAALHQHISPQATSFKSLDDLIRNDT